MNEDKIKQEYTNIDFYKKVIENVPIRYAYHKILLDTIPDLIFFKDTEGVYMECNPSFCEFVGKSREDILGKTDYDIFSKEVADFFRSKDQEIQRQMCSRHNEEWITYPDGRKALMDTLKTPCCDNEGSFMGILGVSRNITENKQSEERQRESEANFRTFFETMDDMIFVANNQGIIFYTNEAVSRKLGYTKIDLQGMHVLDLHPNEKRGEAEQIFEDMFAGRCNSCPLPLARKDGTYVPVETRVWFGKWDSKECIFGISKDLSIQQAAFDKFHKLFNNNPALMAVSSLPDRKFVEVNNAFLEKLGFKREEIIGRTAQEIGLFVENDKQVEVADALKKDGRIKDIELKVKRKDGQIIDGLFSGEIISNQIENSYLTVMTDISYKKKAEVESIRISERLKLATKAANVGIWEYDILNGTLIWDDEMYSLYGISKESFSGAYEAWENGLHPDDLESCRQHLNDAVNAIRDFNPEFRVVWNDGSVHYIKANSVVIKDEQGAPIKMYGTNWDVTERIRNEEEVNYQIQMQDILMNIASQYINISLDEVEQKIHQSLADLGGFVKADRAYVFEYDWEQNICNNTYEWCGAGISTQINELQGVNLEFIPQWVEAHRQGKAMHIADVLSLPENDGVRQVLEPQEIKSIITIPMMNESECMGFVGFDSVKEHHKYSENEKKLLTLFANMLININRRSILEQNMNHARAQAESASIAKSQFLANMSHEIRTPMNGILGFLELLQMSNLSLEQKDLIREAKSASEVLLYLINDILDFSKIEAGKLVMENIEFNIRTVIEDAVSIIVPKATEKNLELYTMINASVPEEVVGDPSRLRQILNNLLSNAVKFTKHGEISVTVDCIEKEKEMAMIMFEVKDTGIGISKEDVGKLFQSFNQADASTTRKYGGTGLGLAISKELVKLMGGQISVESILGEGSTFRFNLFFKIVKRAKEQTYDFAKFENVNVLIVDDDHNNQKIISSYLQGTGIMVFEAKDAGIAISTIISNANTENKINIAIIEYQMPGMSGSDLAITLKNMQLAQGIKLILLESASQKYKESDAKDNCFSGYLTKPVRRDDLVNCIVGVLGLKKNQEDVMIPTVKEAKNTLKPRILLVEDNEINCKIMTRMLKAHGMTCDVAKDGREAYMAVRKKDYDIVFMDCQMPVMDGYKSTAKIREDEGEWKHTTIIAMTANAMEGDRAKCIEAGMDDYISKPIDFVNLFQLIDANTKHNEDSFGHFDLIDENIDRFIDITGMEKEDANELFKEYINYLPEILKEINVNILHNDFEKIAQLAHQLKGSAGNLRITSIYEIAVKLEETAKKHKKEECERLINEIQNLFH